MYDRKIKELTTEESKLVARALGIIMTEEFSLKTEIVAIRKILKALVRPHKTGEGYDLLSDIQLVERRS